MNSPIILGLEFERYQTGNALIRAGSVSTTGRPEINVPQDFVDNMFCRYFEQLDRFIIVRLKIQHHIGNRALLTGLYPRIDVCKSRAYENAKNRRRMFYEAPDNLLQALSQEQACQLNRELLLGIRFLTII